MTTEAVSLHLLHDIIDRSSSIDERLSSDFEPRADPEGKITEDKIVEARLAAWCDTIAKGDWDRFALRLSWDGLDLAAARRAVGPVTFRADGDLPEWAAHLAEILDHHRSGNPVRPDELGFLRAQEPLPFEDVLSFLVVLAHRRLAGVASAETFSPTARADLERGLLMSLITASSDTLLAEFEIAKSRRQSSWARLISISEDPDDASLYRDYAAGLTSGGIGELFAKYPVLGRRLAEICQLWVEATAELYQRLESDLADLEQTFGTLGAVSSAQPSLSDPHNGRRRVVSLIFESGRRLVYKPKDMGTEAQYNRLLAWLNERGAPLDFRVLDVLDRTTHGWVEFVDHPQLADQAAAARYYRRAGMLLCLIYLLEGTDCHYENIVANGEYPVLVDAETLIHHRAREKLPDDGGGAQALANEQLDYSVLRSGMLPRWQVGGDGRTAYDVSGLGETAGQELPYQAPRWTRVNTDRMAVESIRITIPPQTNVPLLDDQQLSLRDYGRQVVEGFESMYHFLAGQRDALLDCEPLLELARQRVRFVYRPTKVYALILNSLQSRRFLRDGVDQSIYLEQLGRAQVPAYGPLSVDAPLLWPVFAAERRAMERGDIPFFSARADSDALGVGAGEEIAEAFLEPGFELVRRMLSGAGPEDLRRQLAFAEGSIYAQVAREPSADQRLGDGWSEAEAGELPSTDVFVDKAIALADDIADKAIRGEDGSATWITPQYLVQAERFQLRPMDDDLYGGAAGLALFFATAHAFAPERRFDELALAALKPLRSTLRDRPDRLADELGIGGGSGLGSVIYALVRVGGLLSEPDLLADARLAAALISDERIEADHDLDVMGGAAGAILGLVALHQVSPGAPDPGQPDPGQSGAERRRADGAVDVLARAVACGEHLLSHRTASAAGPRAWASFDGRLTTGFSHGAAGISYALLRLHQVHPDDRFAQAAAEAVEYEATTYSAENGNWADYWKRDEPLYVCSWCHGAPGIGLGRLGSLSALDTPRVREDVELAVESTLRFGLQLIDHLCCGNLGRADMMLQAGLVLGRPELVAAARNHAWRALSRAERSGGFILNSMLPHGVHSPGFFQGTAGIGYELLRLAAPAEIGSVLIWE